jgi:hypothetical protein
MLEDRQLEKLIRMAGEVEAMDALASGPGNLRLAGEPVRHEAGRRMGGRWRLMGAGLVTAAAAAAALFVLPTVTAPSVKPVPVSPGAIALKPKLDHPELWSGTGAAWPGELPWPLNGKPVIETVADSGGESMAKPEIRGALLAILEDDSGRVECVKWVEHDWNQPGHTLNDTKASDLVALSLMMSCDRTPRQMTVVGLRGPVDELPLGDASAAEMATCIMHAPAKCSTMTCCNPGAALDCIPDDVNVRLERVSFR